MTWQDIELSKEDFSTSGWDVVVSQISKEGFIGFCRVFGQKVIEARNSKNTKMEAIYTILTILTGFELDSSSTAKPFSYTGDLELINDQHLGALRAWAPEISDLRLQARIADALWFRKREPRQDYILAQLAVDSHFKIAQTREDSISFKHIERAYWLAKSLGYREADIIKYIEEILDKSNEEEKSFLPAKLMELLQDGKKGDATKLVTLAENIAKKSESEHDWHRARSYWEVTTRWYQIMNDSQNARLSWISFSETYVSESQKTLISQTPSYLHAASLLDQAITALRKTSDTKKRVDELCKLRLIYGEKTHKEMILFSQTANIGDAVEQTRKSMEGKTLKQSIFSLVLLGASPSVADLRKTVQEICAKHPLQVMFPMQIQNENGRVTARQPSMFSGDPNEVEEAILAEMFKHSANFYQGTFANAAIEPARYQINLEHHMRINDWLPIVFNSPFVPMNREYIFAEGLDAGLKGNFMIAAHLLIPQVENSMRVR